MTGADFDVIIKALYDARHVLTRAERLRDGMQPRDLAGLRVIETEIDYWEARERDARPIPDTNPALPEPPTTPGTQEAKRRSSNSALRAVTAELRASLEESKK